MLKKSYLIKSRRNSSINELLDPFQSVITSFYVNMAVYHSLFLYKSRFVFIIVPLLTGVVNYLALKREKDTF